MGCRYLSRVKDAAADAADAADADTASCPVPVLDPPPWLGLSWGTGSSGEKSTVSPQKICLIEAAWGQL